MTITEFQKKRGVFGHSVLKNGVIMRLPEEAKNFILWPGKDQSCYDFLPPEKITSNLHFAAQAWIVGTLPESQSVPASIQMFLISMRDLRDFSPADRFGDEAKAIVSSVNQCQPCMNALLARRTPSPIEWRNCINGLQATYAGIQSMESGHPNFSKWLRCTLVAAPF